MAWDQMKFDAALANKLRNQDTHAAVEGFNATTNRMNAATQADLLPSQQATHLAAAQAGLMNAGTTRATLAQQSPGALTPQQVGAYGLGRTGFTGVPLEQQGLRSPVMQQPGMGVIEQQWADRQARDRANPGPGMGTPTSYADITGQKPQLISDRAYPNGARGGPMGDVERDTGRDTQHAMVRPGEYMVDPHAVGQAFGGGDYHQGVRNLNRIIHDATGYEPGATYAKKGKVGYADSGQVQPTIPERPDVTAARKLMEREQQLEGYIVNAATIMRESPSPEARAAHAAVSKYRDQESKAMRKSMGIRGYDRGGEVQPRKRKFSPLAVSPMARFQAAMGAAPAMPSFGGAPEPMHPEIAAAAARPVAPAPEFGVPMDAALSQPHTVAGPYEGGKLDALLFNNSRVPAPNAPGTIATTPAATPAAPGLRGKYDMSEDVGTSARATPIPKWTPQPQHITESGGQFQIRDKIQSKGRPGETFSLDYGAGHGMGPTKAPIYATADASGRFNMFSDRAPPPPTAPAPAAPGLRAPPMPAPQAAPPMPQAPLPPAAPTPYMQQPPIPLHNIHPARNMGMRKGGVVPGFAYSGPAPGGPSEPWMSQINTPPPSQFAEYGGGPEGAAARAQIESEAAAARAQAAEQQKGARWRDAYERFKTRASEPVDVKAGLRTAAEAVKPYVPSAKTIGGVTEFAGKKVLRPLALANDVVGFTDVATDPRHHGWETAGKVATDVAGKGLNWGGAGGGALAGGMAGAAIGGPFAPVTGAIGALAGGIAGYEGIDWLQGQAREALGGGKNLPSDESQGWFSKLTGRGQPPDPNAVDPRVADFQKRGAAWAANERKEEAARAQAQGQPGPGGVAARPSLRDMLIKQYMDMENNTNPYAGSQANMHKQHDILNYLAAGERGGSSTDPSKAMEQHEKDIEASLLPQFDTTTTDPKTGKTEKVSHPELFEKFAADLATRNQNVYQMSRKDRDKALAAWKALHRSDERANQIVAGSGDPNQLMSDRIQPLSLRSGSMGFGDWWGNPNVSIGDYGSSFFGKGLQNRVAVRTMTDPDTGLPVQQRFPAAKVFGNEQGIDADSMRYARGQ